MSSNENLLKTTVECGDLSSQPFDEARYRQTINMCAENKLDVPLPNGDARHAAVLFEKFLESAQKEVIIYTGALFEGIYDKPNIIEKALSFLKEEGRRLMIAYANPVDVNEILGRRLVKSVIEAINAESIAGTFKLYDAHTAGQRNHFAVMDSLAYRQETDAKTRSAYANFGDEAYSLQLRKAFDEIIESSSMVFPEATAKC